MSIPMVGIDFAKNSFQLHGVDDKVKVILKRRIDKVKVILKRRISRDKLTVFVDNLMQCTIAMELCSGANYLAGVFMCSGHIVK